MGRPPLAPPPPPPPPPTWSGQSSGSTLDGAATQTKHLKAAQEAKDGKDTQAGSLLLQRTFPPPHLLLPPPPPIPGARLPRRSSRSSDLPSQPPPTGGPPPHRPPGFQDTGRAEPSLQPSFSPRAGSSRRRRPGRSRALLPRRPGPAGPERQDVLPGPGLPARPFPGRSRSPGSRPSGRRERRSARAQRPGCPWFLLESRAQVAPGSPSSRVGAFSPVRRSGRSSGRQLAAPDLLPARGPRKTSAKTAAAVEHVQSTLCPTPALFSAPRPSGMKGQDFPGGRRASLCGSSPGTFRPSLSRQVAAFLRLAR